MHFEIFPPSRCYWGLAIETNGRLFSSGVLLSVVVVELI